MRTLHRRLMCLAVLVVGCGLAGCSSSGTPQLTVEDVVASANAGDLSAAYAAITNHGDGDDALVAVRCSCSERVSIHHTEHHDGLSKMVPTDRLEVPAGERVALTPGGTHLMLEGLHGPLAAGDEVELTFEFEHTGELTLSAPIVEPAELADRVEPNHEGA